MYFFTFVFLIELLCHTGNTDNYRVPHIVLFQLKMLAGNSEEADFATKALFSKHPEMKGNNGL